MCLIIVKPAGISLPPKKIIQQAFSNNDDGMGVAWTFPNEDVVHIRKGAMSHKQAKKLLRNIGDVTGADMIIHFRTATEGKVCKENCHPYPISDDEEKLKALSIDCEVAVAHNGIIWNLGDSDDDAIYSVKGGVYSGGVWGNDLVKEETDTQRFIKKYLVGMGKAIFNKQVATMIGAYTNSKFVFLSPQCTIIVGDFVEKDGCFYSNTTYKSLPVIVGLNNAEDEDNKLVGVFEDGFIICYGEKVCDNCGETVKKTFFAYDLQMYLCQHCKEFYKDPLPESHSDNYEVCP